MFWISAFHAALAENHQHYENLHNPTNYLFNVSKEKVIEIFRDSRRRLAPPPEPLHGSFCEDTGFFEFDLMNFYTTRYWTGRQETDEEVDPPEAGRIGTIQADFEVHVVSTSENQTLVSVAAKNFKQQVGRRYKIFPHFHKGPVFKDVKSDTYFEYVFLLRLGELLGEKDMPPLKGKP